MSHAQAEASTLKRISQASEEQASDSKVMFGFWVYLMTDCVLFASLFATYAVLHNNNFGGPTARSLFSLPYALAETLILLTSSFSCGLAILSARLKNKAHTLFWLCLTFVLGAAFLAMELSEFGKFKNMGASWRRSGFLSSYFTLVGTHGLHISVGLLWLLVMIFRIYQSGLGHKSVRQLTILSLFWHFLDVIWIFIFSVVYLMGGGIGV